MVWCRCIGNLITTGIVRAADVSVNLDAANGIRTQVNVNRADGNTKQWKVMTDYCPFISGIVVLIVAVWLFQDVFRTDRKR